jgi:hypothetical protein
MADTNVELKLRNVRISFANLFKPQEFKDAQTGKVRWTYNVNALIPKYLPDGSVNPQMAQCQEAIRQAIVARWGDKAPKIPAERRCFRDGEPKDPDTGQREALYDGYEGCCFLSANKTVEGPEAPNPLVLIDSRKGPDGKFPRLKLSDGKLYSGCVVDMIVRVYGFDGSKLRVPDRVNASLEAVKFVRHGEAFGAKPVDAESSFEEEAAEDGFDEPTAKSQAPAADADADGMLG